MEGVYIKFRMLSVRLQTGKKMGLFNRAPKIRVVYRNGTREKVTPNHLTTLLEANEIAQFQRSEGWVTVGIDRVRGMGGPPYLGENRRNSSDATAALNK